MAQLHTQTFQKLFHGLRCIISEMTFMKVSFKKILYLNALKLLLLLFLLCEINFSDSNNAVQSLA